MATVRNVGGALATGRAAFSSRDLSAPRGAALTGHIQGILAAGQELAASNQGGAMGR